MLCRKIKVEFIELRFGEESSGKYIDGKEERELKLVFWRVWYR